MALLAGRETMRVTMPHASKPGQSKLISQCSLPLTGKGCIKKVLTDLAFIEIKEGKFHLLERAPNVSIEEIIKLTDGELVVTGDSPEMKF
jgi:3-oxoacid CoA-transferase subunit B